MEFRTRSQPNPFFLRFTVPKIHVIFFELELYTCILSICARCQFVIARLLHNRLPDRTPVKVFLSLNSANPI